MTGPAPNALRLPVGLLAASLGLFLAVSYLLCILLGLVLPGWGLSQKLPRLIGASRARELSFTGNFIDARRAEAWGLINRVVPHDELLPAALQLAADMASCLPGALRAYKRLMDDGAALPLDAALRLEKERSKEWAGSLTAAAMADRSRAVVHRGRTQLATPGPG